MTALRFEREIKLKGYHPGHNPKRDYRDAKKPITGASWTDLNGDGEAWEKEGGWIGGAVPEGLVICDIDDKETGAFLHSALKRQGASYYLMETPHGYQFFFADNGGVKTQSAKSLTAGGFLSDYRLHGRGYTVLTGRTIDRVNDDRNLSPMPAIFLPFKRFDAVKDSDKLLPMPIAEGQRNDIIFAHACRLRSLSALRGISLDVEGTLQEINTLFCEPPLSAYEVRAIVQSAERYKEPEPQAEEIRIKPLRAVNADEFLTLTFPPREEILSPIMQTQWTGLVHSPRGMGKTHLAGAAAVAVATGGQIMKWAASIARGVLYIDGEMPGAALQERFARWILSADKPLLAPLRIITPDLQPYGMPDLSTKEGQAAIEPFLDEISLVIVDSLSTLCRNGRENEGEGWLPIQEWALYLRKCGLSVLFLHHSGKSGQQRGTSRREDILDMVINLKRPADYRPDEGARFEVHFEKARGIHGDDVKPFEAKLTSDGDRFIWLTRDLQDSLMQRVADLLNEGVPQREIPELLGITKGTVSKHKARAQAMGLLSGATA